MFKVNNRNTRKKCEICWKLSANPTKWSNTLKTIRWILPMNCSSVFDHFVGLALNGWNTKHFHLLTSRFNIKAFSLIISTHRCIFSQYGDIFPWIWVPVWIIVSFFRALVTVAIAIRILSCVFCALTDILISNKQTWHLKSIKSE